MFYENRDFAQSRIVDRQIKYGPYNLRNFKSIPQIHNLSNEQLFEIEVVGNVLPFKANNYVVEQLIDWDNVPDDPMFILTFPQKDMLKSKHFNMMAEALKREAPKKEIISLGNMIRMELNPNPAGQADYNVPVLKGRQLQGMQHKYKETVLFFPSQGQTCHAYCTFCFRWPQLSHMDNLKFSSNDIEPVIKYIKSHEEVSDLLITGGDPMIMSGKIFSNYINHLLYADILHLQTIRIGSKALAYWPHKFVTDKDSDLILKSFEKVVKSGRQLAFMAHFNHHKELKTDIVKKAIGRILNTGATIRTQSPIFRHINDDSSVWKRMWTEQVRLGCIPYYMFIPRETGAQDYFKVSLTEAWDIFRNAYMHIGGNARTVRGPVMSCGPGKVQVLGVNKINNEEVMILRFIQGRNPEWVHLPFFAEKNDKAYWMNDLKPAFGDKKFFFEDELEDIYESKSSMLARVED
ncbi:KamA family radical SAM protein [Bacteroidota bacterium]